MLPRDDGGLKLDLADYGRPADDNIDFLVYSLIAATIAVGVALAVVFVAF